MKGVYDVVDKHVALFYGRNCLPSTARFNRSSPVRPNAKALVTLGCPVLFLFGIAAVAVYFSWFAILFYLPCLKLQLVHIPHSPMNRTNLLGHNVWNVNINIICIYSLKVFVTSAYLYPETM